MHHDGTGLPILKKVVYTLKNNRNPNIKTNTAPKDICLNYDNIDLSNKIERYHHDHYND